MKSHIYKNYNTIPPIKSKINAESKSKNLSASFLHIDTIDTMYIIGIHFFLSHINQEKA